MRQKKSNLIYYIVATICIAVVGFVALTEIPVEVTHVEESVK